MIILGMDTSSEYAVLVLSDENGQCYGSLSERHERDLSSRLYGWLDTLLARASVRFEDVDAFAAGLGPGSFTGVRVGVTTMRTLAQVTGKPLVGVPTMAIYAAGAARLAPLAEQENAPATIVLLPSRRNEVYAQTYYAARGVVPVAPSAATYAEAREIVQQLGGGASVTGPATLLDTLFGDEKNAGLVRVPQELPDPLSLALLAAEAYRNGRLQDALSLDPMYVVPPAVSQHKTRSVGP